MSTIPFEVQQQVIKCFGTCFYYKDTVETFMRSCDVPNNLIYEDKEKPKFVWAKNVLMELNKSENGKIIIKKMVAEFYKMRNIPTEVKERNEGIDELRKLKRMVNQNKSILTNMRKSHTYHQTKQQEKILSVQRKNEKMMELKHKFFFTI